MLCYGIVFMQKFGSSILQLTTIPGVVGGKLAGAVRIPRSVRPDSGFRITLRCTEEDECKGKQHVAWEEEQLVLKPTYDCVRPRNDRARVVCDSVRLLLKHRARAQSLQQNGNSKRRQDARA